MTTHAQAKANRKAWTTPTVRGLDLSAHTDKDPGTAEFNFEALSFHAPS